MLEELSGIIIDEFSIQQTCESLLSNIDHYIAYVALDHSETCIGVITTFETYALYACGKIGTIQELYVAPEHRSMHVGKVLLQCVIDYGKTHSWRRIEVGAPNAQLWGRTLSFYKNMGFSEIGPRLKLTFE
ncbi:GNAT family N-acetyltransferase [Paenibacillus sp. MMS18-CY102]|uniref:GNAT family N-acetyltransferase n=1 Tax=Paenibacillus sp. MMS18-CY102 TaxID=2682849 RepID=UPI00136662B7|nr:GNAT family N-acetyltransferase [Paenibacillus sp. MMS18-CY102]MWC27601.1 GNAT family N-acetyltransferase [Paenibacillus sp. MMS18-CY102]